MLLFYHCFSVVFYKVTCRFYKPLAKVYCCKWNSVPPLDLPKLMFCSFHMWAHHILDLYFFLYMHLCYTLTVKFLGRLFATLMPHGSALWLSTNRDILELKSSFREIFLFKLFINLFISTDYLTYLILVSIDSSQNWWHNLIHEKETNDKIICLFDLGNKKCSNLLELVHLKSLFLRIHFRLPTILETSKKVYEVMYEVM